MGRRNEKQAVIDFDSSIKKSNELSMSKLNKGLTLNQMQLLAYAIYSTQKDGKTEFQKVEFEERFELQKYQTRQAKNDSYRLMKLSFSIEDLESDYFKYWNVFQSIEYNAGKFSFKWTDNMIPHILELKTYSLVDLTTAAKFKSGFTWTLYEYLKAHYGNWNKKLSKEALLRLFNVEDRETYQRNTNSFKTSVLDVAIEEINEHTELYVWYHDERVGNKITGFTIHWSTGNVIQSATQKQLKLLNNIYKEIDGKLMDYLSIPNRLELVRDNLLRVKELEETVKKGISIDEAKEIIRESLSLYDYLEDLLQMGKEGKTRDNTIYFNWLEE